MILLCNCVHDLFILLFLFFPFLPPLVLIDHSTSISNNNMTEPFQILCFVIERRRESNWVVVGRATCGDNIDSRKGDFVADPLPPH